jgi:hypothetical protein
MKEKRMVGPPFAHRSRGSAKMNSLTYIGGLFGARQPPRQTQSTEQRQQQQQQREDFAYLFRMSASIPASQFSLSAHNFSNG